MLAAIVEWAALGKVALYSLVGAVAISGLFTTGLLLVESRDGHAASGTQRAAGAVLLAACAALVVFGLYVLFSTK